MEQGEIEALLAQAKKGNQRAFNSLFDTHWEYVYRFLVQRIQNDQLAEEIAIESFAKAFDNIKNFNSNYTFKTWVITIAKNNLIAGPDAPRFNFSKLIISILNFLKRNFKGVKEKYDKCS